MTVQNPTPARARAWITAAAALLLLVLAVEIVGLIRQDSLTWDEGDHLFAGYMMWKTGDYGLNPEHPPLVKLLAALPLLPMHLQTPPLQGRYFKAEAYLDGRDLIYGQPAGPGFADTIIFRARLLPGLLTLLLAWVAFLCASEMFGDAAGLLALLLLTFEPNLIAHSARVTTDVAVTCFFLAGIYTFYRYVKRPTLARLALVGLCAGLALASKHSAILLFPMLALVALSEVLWPVAAQPRGRRALRLAGALCAVVVMAVVILWAFYGFRYAARPAGLVLQPSLAEYVSPLAPHEARAILLLARFHLLPESYLYGLADVRTMANGMPSYFLGQVHTHGVWYYFPVAFSIKATGAMLVLLAFAAGLIVTGKLGGRREILFLTLPPLFYLAIAMDSHLNIGARHILILFVFSAVLLGGAAAVLLRRGRAWAVVVVLLLAWHVVSTLRSFPAPMAYANEFWGGPARTYKYLSDSNTDWGQQLKAVKTYLDRRGIRECWFAYFVDPAIRPSDYGIPCHELPTPDTGFFGEQVDMPPVISGTVLISAGTLTGFELGSSVLNPYRDFEQLRPIDSIQNGVLVYQGTFRVPLASALAYAQRSSNLLEAGKPEEALGQAEQSVAVEPDALQTQMALGDALATLHRAAEARTAYQRALVVTERMEPDAREEWAKKIQQKTAALQ